MCRQYKLCSLELFGTYIVEMSCQKYTDNHANRLTLKYTAVAGNSLYLSFSEHLAKGLIDWLKHTGAITQSEWRLKPSQLSRFWRLPYTSIRRCAFSDAQTSKVVILWPEAVIFAWLPSGSSPCQANPLDGGLKLVDLLFESI